MHIFYVNYMIVFMYKVFCVLFCFWGECLCEGVARVENPSSMIEKCEERGVRCFNKDFFFW
jgi:hypothetical protein